MGKVRGPRGGLTDVERMRLWRQRHPEKVKAANGVPRIRSYEKDKDRITKWRHNKLLDPAYRARVAKVANDRATKRRRWLDDYKLRKGCIDCGYRAHPAALHFDHVRGDKKINVCHAKSMGQALEEISKCEVRCANCHAVRSFKFHHESIALTSQNG